MKTKYSKSWVSSKQPRRQRKYRYNAPLHARQKMLSAHLDRLLRKDYKRRSMPVRVGDEVVVMNGEFRKKNGKVTGVNLKKLKIYIDGIKRKKVSGEEKQIPIDPSNVRIVKLNIDDARRRKIFKRKGIKETKTETKAEARKDGMKPEKKGHEKSENK